MGFSSQMSIMVANYFMGPASHLRSLTPDLASTNSHKVFVRSISSADPDLGITTPTRTQISPKGTPQQQRHATP